MRATSSRGAWWLIHLLCIVGLFALAGSLSAQDPVPRDTVPAAGRDTVVVPIPPEATVPDTVPIGEIEADTIRPAPRLPELPRTPASGWSDSEWEWDQAELDRWHGLSVLELVEQVPGIVPTRAGWYGQPVAISAFGEGGGRLRVFVDGFELDPLSSTQFDLQHMAVADLQHLRVRRGLLETRIEISTFRLTERRPFSQIEASTGVYGTRYIRGLFSTVLGEQGMLTVGIDVTDTRGWLGQHPFSANGVVARWSRLFGSGSGIEIEYRQMSLNRPAQTAFPIDAERRDLVVRGRHQLTPRLFLDANLGRNWRTAAPDDSLGAELASLQGRLGAHYEIGRGWIGGGLRLRNPNRDGFAAPGLDLELDGGYRLPARATLTGSLRQVTLDDLRGSEAEARLRVGPFSGFHAFASIAGGTRPVGVARDTTIQETVEGEDGEPVTTERRAYRFAAVGSESRGLRAGVEWQGTGARIGGALVRHEAGTVVPFGLPFDRAVQSVATQPLTGFEAFASVPLLTPALRVEGSYSAWGDVGFRPYLPEQYARGALVFSRLYYEGNFEPTLRLEGYRRGSSIVPGPDRATFAAVAEPYTWTNLFLQIRVLDVRLFLIWENPLDNRLAADLPGAERGGALIYYGVRWHFLD